MSLQLLDTIFTSTDQPSKDFLLTILPVKDGLESRQAIFDAPRTAFKQKTDPHLANSKALAAAYKYLANTGFQSGKRRLQVLQAQLPKDKVLFLNSCLAYRRNEIAEAYQAAMVDCPNAGRNVFAEQELANCKATAANIYNDKIAASKLPGFKPTPGWFAAANKARIDADRACNNAAKAAQPTPAQVAKAKEDCKAAARATREASLAVFNSAATQQEYAQFTNNWELWWHHADEYEALVVNGWPCDVAYLERVSRCSSALEKYTSYTQSIFELTGTPLPPNWATIKNPPLISDRWTN